MSGESDQKWTVDVWFKDGKQHGRGTITYAGGKRYKVKFEDGEAVAMSPASGPEKRQDK